MCVIQRLREFCPEPVLHSCYSHCRIKVTSIETSTQPSGVNSAATKPTAATQDFADLLAKARGDADAVLKELSSQPDGLSEAEAATRLQQVGTNEIAREHRQSSAMRLLANSNS